MSTSCASDSDSATGVPFFIPAYISFDSSSVASSSTSHREPTMFYAPAYRKPRMSAAMPSALLMLPKPVTQADSITRLTLKRRP